MITKELIDSELESTSAELLAINAELSKMPSGILWVNKWTHKSVAKNPTADSDGLCYRKYETHNGEKKITSITKNKSLVADLARKELLKHEADILQRNIEALTDFRDSFLPNPAASAISSLRPNLKAMPFEMFQPKTNVNTIKSEFRSALQTALGFGSEIKLNYGYHSALAENNFSMIPFQGVAYDSFLHEAQLNRNRIAAGSDEPFIVKTSLIDVLSKTPAGLDLLQSPEFRKAWMSSIYPKYMGYPENLIHPTSHGMVRSKSEQSIFGIADRLGLAFHYEENIIVNGVPCKFTPDICYLRYDGKIIYHEHFGRMDDPGYRMDRQEKLAVYESIGIVPWDNLIETFDTVNGTINPTQIEHILRSWLLP